MKKWKRYLPSFWLLFRGLLTVLAMVSCRLWLRLEWVDIVTFFAMVIGLLFIGHYVPRGIEWAANKYEYWRKS